MMTTEKTLAPDVLKATLAELPGWSIVDHKLHREFKFKDFIQAFGFMTQVALLAQAMAHHPNWSNAYNRVSIDLVTHDANNTVTELDIRLAKQINALSID